MSSICTAVMYAPATILAIYHTLSSTTRRWERDRDGRWDRLHKMFRRIGQTEDEMISPG